MYHIIGDSHVSAFSGQDRMVPFNPLQHSSDRIENIKTYRAGAYTAYNILDKYNEIISIINQYTKKEDIIVFCLGEIDCRWHIPFNAEKENKIIEFKIQECIERYVILLLKIKELGYEVGAISPPASTNWKHNMDMSFPVFGDNKSRNATTARFVQILKEQCVVHNIRFFNLFPYLIDSENNTIMDFYIDHLHLSGTKMIEKIKELFI